MGETRERGELLLMSWPEPERLRREKEPIDGSMVDHNLGVPAVVARHPDIEARLGEKIADKGVGTSYHPRLSPDQVGYPLSWTIVDGRVEGRPRTCCALTPRVGGGALAKEDTEGAERIDGCIDRAWHGCPHGHMLGEGLDSGLGVLFAVGQDKVGLQRQDCIHIDVLCTTHLGYAAQ